MQVAVRCRPLNADEKKAGMTPAVTCDIEAKAININYGNAVYLRRRNLTFDHVFGIQLINFYKIKIIDDFVLSKDLIRDKKKYLILWFVL